MIKDLYMFQELTRTTDITPSTEPQPKIRGIAVRSFLKIHPNLMVVTLEIEHERYLTALKKALQRHHITILETERQWEFAIEKGRGD